MTTTINNKHNKLNFSSEREQSQACLNSAEHEKNQGRKVLNVPNLRFKEFQGEWHSFLINEICSEFKSGKNIKADSISENGEYPVFGGNGLRGYTASYNHEGLYVLIGRQGALCGNVRSVNGKTYITEHAIAAAGNEKSDTSFLHYLFIKMNLGQYSDQSAQPGLAVNKLLKLKVSLPPISEQKKIAKLLSLLDERIATQNKVIDKLQSLIKGLQDNLLDNPLWKKTYLRSFMQFFPTNSLSWEQLSYEEGEIRNLHYGLIHGFQTRGINSASLPMIKNEAIPKQYTLCQVGDVAFADASEDTGEIAKSVEFVNTIEGDTICGLHTIHGRDIKNRTVIGFKGFAFNSRYFHNQIKRLAQGTKVFSITANNLSSCYVYLPDFDTQKAIVELLKAYEEKLLVSKRLLERHEKQKEYLLRQMFI